MTSVPFANRLFIALVAFSFLASVAGASIEYNRDIRRILSDNCFKCHGPDEDERKGGTKNHRLRLDTPDSYQAIVPGHPEKSEVIKRITTTDEDDKMPPVKSGKKLTEAEIKLLTEWIKQGAKYSTHWAYVKPQRPEAPKVANKRWAKNEIDLFVLARLQKEKLTPSREADRSALIRRVSLDLTGLPPTLEEVAAFLKDKSANAYETLVDRLLTKEAFGEHWARMWLDQARYADSAGYADDPARTIWAYRDWVIRALNENLPFDEFTIEQLAGDLLEEPTDDQVVATGFHRNTMTNNEGGTNDEEFRNVAVVDRVNTTMSVWMGTTMACAQCHTHKYDPISQEEYFKVFAILNNTSDADKTDESPIHTIWTKEQKAQRTKLEKEIAGLEKTVSTVTPELVAAQGDWEKNLPRHIEWTAFKPATLESKSGATFKTSESGEIEVDRKGTTDVYTIQIPIATKQTLTALRLETFPARDRNFVVSRIMATNDTKAIEFKAAYADYSQEKFEAQSIINNKDVKEKGWAVAGQADKLHSLTLIPKEALQLAEANLTIVIEQLSKHENHTLGKFRLSFSGETRAAEVAGIPQKIQTILSKNEREESDREELKKYYLTIAPGLKKEREQLASLKKEFSDMKPVTTTPILTELVADKRRKTKLQIRGNYLNHGKEVSPGFPVAFNPPTEADPNRLTLAKWLVSSDNPLTARVTVNRFWESIFGIGIVRTSEDFGMQGDAPTHPELLDWLATEFVASNWDVKHMLKLMVTSATYRQSSRVTPELLARDPDNQLLARGPRFRLSAEMIRDQAMAISGLLSPKMFGPPVKPPQPKLGLSAAFGSKTDWETSAGEDRYRRGIYTMWRRSNPYPSMATFDAPNREVCTVKRDRSNTPLQALVTLNDPVYVEASQALAHRLFKAGAKVSEQISRGFELCLARSPTKKELAATLGLYEKSHARYAANNEEAKIMATKPLGPLPAGADAAEIASLTIVANVLLNLDETLMKR